MRSDGRPLAEARVTAWSANRAVGTITTDRSGRFDFGVDVEVGTPLQVSASWRDPEGWTPGALRGHADGARAGIDEPEIRLFPMTTEQPVVEEAAR